MAGAIGSVEDPWNIVSGNPDDYATMSLDASVIGAASISVVDAQAEYPAGTIAGFTIETPSVNIAEVNLLSAITITTYLDGVEQESFGGAGNLINLGLLGLNIIGQGGGIYNIGFLTQLPFDEVQITMIEIVDVAT